MSTPLATVPPHELRRQILLMLVRSVLAAVVVVWLYFLLPLNEKDDTAYAWMLVAVVLLGLVATFQFRALLVSETPRLRAIEVVATLVPLFLVLFAATYYIMSANYPDSFSQQPLSRLDALYFTLTTFATVGFGDITPKSETARAIVMCQMVLGLILLGAGARLLLGAVKLGEQRRAHAEREAATDGPTPGQPTAAG